MAGWIKERTKLHKLIGHLKDHVSLGRAVAKGSLLSGIEVAIVQATRHDEALPDKDDVKSILACGSGSRMRVSHCVCVIMDRLNTTRNWMVALKCLILIHVCLYEGGFMFRDQLSIHPARGGHNYLNLSRFKDTSSAFSWVVSGWIRWYARFIELWIQTSRSVGSFLDSKIEDCSNRTDKLLSLTSVQLTQEILSLQSLLEEACGWEVDESVLEHPLVKEGLSLVVLVTMNAYQELKFRMLELPERMTTLPRAEAFDLIKVCEKLSSNSMALIHLLEVGSSKSSFAHETLGTAWQVLFADYELMNLRDALRLAATQNTPLLQFHVDDGSGSQFKRSQSWKNPDVLGEESKFDLRGRSMSHFYFSDTFL